MNVNILITSFTNRNLHHLLRNRGNQADCNQTGKQGEKMRHMQMDINMVAGHLLNSIITTTNSNNVLPSQRFMWQLKCYALVNIFSFLFGVTCFHFFLGAELLGKMESICLPL